MAKVDTQPMVPTDSWVNIPPKRPNRQANVTIQAPKKTGQGFSLIRLVHDLDPKKGGVGL